MSSLRNAVKRRTHKERAQPAHRKRLGLLEKKKDYKLRAADFQQKNKALTTLHRKAAFRNPDEFYFKMVSSRTKEGVHVVDKEKPDNDVVKLVRTQNMAYLQMQKGMEQKKVEKLRENLHFLSDDKPVNKHTIFLDDEDEARAFDKAAYFGTAEAFADRAFNRPKRETLAKDRLVLNGDAKAVRLALKERERAYEELEDRVERTQKIDLALRHMDLHKKLSGKGTRWKVKDGTKNTPPVYVWKQERKR